MIKLNDLTNNADLGINGIYLVKSKKKERALNASTQVWEGGQIIVVAYSSVRYVKITDGAKTFSQLTKVGQGGSGGSNDASDLTEGTLPDARLSNNVAFKSYVTGITNNKQNTLPSGTDRQVVGYSGGSPVAATLGWKQLSDMPSAPAFSNGVLAGTAFQPNGSALFAFIEMALGTPKADTIATYSSGGVLKIASGVANNDAVTFNQLKTQVFTEAQLPAFTAQDIFALFDNRDFKIEGGKIRSVSSTTPSLAQTTVTFGTSTTTQNVVNWTSVPNATSYVVQSSLNSNMSSPTTIYTGALLTYTDTGLIASTTYYYTVTASANGYTSSTSAVASKATSGGGVNLGTYVGSSDMQYSVNTSFDTEGNVTKPNPADGSPSALAIAFASNENGFVNHAYKAFTIPADGSLPAESSTGVLTIGVGIDPFYGINDCLCAVYVQAGGQIFYKKEGGSVLNTATGVLSINGIMQLRIDATTAYIEYSNNGGVNWTTLTTIARPAGVIRSKFNIEGNQYRIFNLRQFKG